MNNLSIVQIRMLGQIAAQQKIVFKFEKEENDQCADSVRELVNLLLRAEAEGMNTPEFPLVYRLSKMYMPDHQVEH